VSTKKESVVSSARVFLRHHKRLTDRAISAAFTRLGGDTAARASFDELLSVVRVRAPRLLDAPVTVEGHVGVEALVNLARHWRSHIRPTVDWTGLGRSWRPIVDSLAHHLLAQYRVPMFLSAAWYATDEAFGERKREWFVAHARGAPFRSLDLPIRMTRRMEHVFLASPAHLSIEHAMRRSELIAAGANVALVGAVLAARPASDLGHGGSFWPTVWHFMIREGDSLDLEQVAPLLDFLHAIRHEHVAIETEDGLVVRPPPLPAFSLRGRTMASVMRLMEEWHRGLGTSEGGYAWDPSRFRPFAVEVPSSDLDQSPTVWELTELTNSGQLRAEGDALRHCVASYGYSCWKGRSRIWSLRRRRGLACRPVVTVEVNPLSRTIVQARGLRNRRPSGRLLGILQTWAAREGLRIGAI
jgi:hypothetical protein